MENYHTHLKKIEFQNCEFIKKNVFETCDKNEIYLY